MSNEEYAIERVFTFVDWLENGHILVKTEYGSLLTEEMLQAAYLAQCEKVWKRLGRDQSLRIRVEVLNRKEGSDAHRTDPL